MKKLLLLVTFLLAMGSSFSQTTLINSTGDGGFENGATFTANGWTDVNHTTNAWYVGTVSAVSGNGAFVSNDLGVTNAYTNNASQVSHFYRDITFPAGETYIYLNFDLKCEGEGTTTIWDALKVYLVATSTTPVAGTALASGQLGKSLNLTGGGFVKVNVQVPASFAGTTSRIVFSWVNDASGGTNPPATVDNISLVSANLPALSGGYTIDNTLPTGGTNFKSFSEAFIALNAAGISGAVTFNVTPGQTFTENPPALTATGTSTNTIIFQKSGAGSNPIISASGFGTRSSSSTNVALNDIAVLIFGGDYIAFDGIDVNNTSNQLEGGYAIANASGTDGGQYNVIKNCVVNLGLNNIINNTQTRAYRIVTPTAATNATGANSYNTFQNIVSQNTYWGVFLYGTSAALPDINNLLTATPGFTSPLSGAKPGYNDIGNTTVNQLSGFRAVEIIAQQGFIIEKTEIRNMQNTSISTTSDLAGFLINSTITASSKNITFRNNLIHDLLSLSTAAQTVYGYWINGNAFAASSTCEVSNSKIYKITASVSGSSGTVRGILLNMTAATQTLNIYNNYVYQLYNPASTASNYAVRCLELNSINGTANVYSNTFYLDAPTTLTGTSAFATACIYMTGSTSTILDMRNNIIVNMSQVTSAAASRAICFAKTTATIGTQIATTTDRNLLYAGTPSAQRLIAYDAATGYQTITTYQAWLGAPREVNAKTELPPFVSTTGTYDLHISPSVPTRVEGNASVTALVTNDYDGDLRNASTPDIGADEGSFTAQLANDIAVIAIITPTNGGTLAVGSTFDPQVSYFNNGTANQAPVPVRFQLIGPSPSTSVVVDLTSSIPTLNADASANVTFTTVNTTGFTPGVYTFKGRAELPGDGYAPNDELTGTLTLAGPLSGTYLVGSSQTAPFNTLSNAVARLNGVGVIGPVIFELTDATYPSETFPIIINSVVGGSSINTVTIKPSSSVSATISGSSTALLKLFGADYIIIDGLNSGGSSLTFNNSNTSGVDLWISSTPTDGATNNIIKNCSLLGSSGTGTIAGIIAGSGAAIGNPAETANSYNTIQGNIFKSTQNGIFINGFATSPYDQGWVINNNTFGSTVAAEKHGFRGMFVGNASNFTISSNSIIGVLSSSSTSSTMSGIQIGGAVDGGTISSNIIGNIAQINTTGWGANGIYLSASTTNSALNIFNNIVYDVTAYGYNGVSQSDNGYGIMINSGGGYNLYYNSVSMNTPQTASTCIPAAINISPLITTANSVTLLNNIFNIPASNTVGTRYAIYCSAANTIFTDINYNDYYSVGTLGFLGSARTTLSDWKTATGKDFSSVSGDPGFTSPTNLLPDGTNPNCWTLNGKGVQIASISTDYAGNSRSILVSTGSTDIGAYEFTPSSIPPSATASGAPVASTTTTYSFAGRQLASINWGAGGTLPSSVDFKYYSGTWPSGASGLYSNAYYDISVPDGAGYTYDIIFNYDPAIIGTIPAEILMKIGKNDGSWVPYQTSSVDVLNKTVTLTGLTTFSLFTFYDENNPVPIEISTFTAKSSERNVVLNWQTKTEVNSSLFEIQRSKENTSEWLSIGKANAAGNSNSPIDYSFTDSKLQSGKYSYRLKMIDADGRYSFSIVVETDVELPKEYAISQNYPNPFNPTTRIDYQLPFDSKVTLELYGITGEKVATIINTELSAGYYTADINAGSLNLASGMYIYRMVATGANNQNFIQVKKLMLTK